MANKSTKAQIEQRLKEVQELLLDGRTRSFIVQYGSKWQVSDRQIDDYIAQATAIIKEINLASVQDNLALITANQWTLYRKAITDNNIPVARQLLMDLAKLRGLDQATINHIIEDKRELSNLSNADLEKLLEGTDELKPH